MASITFDIDGTDKELTLHKWRIVRRSVRSRVNYRNGGSNSNYRAARLFVSLEWEHMISDEYAKFVAIVNGIRSGSTVKIEGTSGLSYFDDTCLSTGKIVELETDEIVESVGEYLEYMPAKMDLVIATGMGLTNVT